jgi:hypothetical protein
LINVHRFDCACPSYALYEARGREDGYDIDDWLEAERENSWKSEAADRPQIERQIIFHSPGWMVLAVLKTEAERLGIPYQTYIGSVLYRIAHGELIDRKTVDLLKQLKVS